MHFDRLKRREFITLLGSSAVAWPLSAEAQQPKQIRLVGVLQDLAESEPVARSEVVAFREALAKLGWTEGGNFRIEVRWGAGNSDRMKALAKEVVDLRPDAILARGTPVTGALAHETLTIPIVFVAVADPIGSGFATSLAHPGGNITGFSNLFSILAAKWVQLLKEIAPHTERAPIQSNNISVTPIIPAFH
jgi:putative ABC transport system substrate-binding protein